MSDLPRVTILIPVANASRLTSKKLLFLDSSCIKNKNSGKKYTWVHLRRASLQYISTESKSTIITQANERFIGCSFVQQFYIYIIE